MLPDGTEAVAGTANARQRVSQANFLLGAGCRCEPADSNFYLRPGLDLNASHPHSGNATERGTDFGLEIQGCPRRPGWNSAPTSRPASAAGRAPLCAARSASTAPMTSTSTPCFPGACNADAWLEAMRAGTQLAAALVTRDGREITFTLALDGFTKAADMHP
jgi:hypothetical protein